MQSIDDYPETCRQAIETVADQLNTDYETAYAIMCLKAVLWDLYPSDKVVVSMILDGKHSRSEKPNN